MQSEHAEHKDEEFMTGHAQNLLFNDTIKKNSR